MCFCLLLSRGAAAQTAAPERAMADPSAPVLVTPHKLLPSWMIRLYRETVRPARGTYCPMHPHCSEYGLEVSRRYHTLKALAMTCDRLLRCGGDEAQYDKAFVDNDYRWLDSDWYDNARAHRVQLSLNSRSGQPTRTEPAPDQRGGSSPAQPVSSDHGDSATYRFAEWLKAQGKYDRAITEYLRLSFLHPGSDFVMDARASVCDCYYLRGSYREAITCAEELLQEPLDQTRRSGLINAVGIASFRNGDYRRASEAFSLALSEYAPDNGENVSRTRLLQALTTAHQREWQRAEQLFTVEAHDSPYAEQAGYCAKLCRKGFSMRRRSPTAAGILAIVPGLGYAYDGYPRTALSALLINTAFIWGAVESFQDDRPGLGSVLSVLGIG
ncbi:MAG: membrane protein insertion efficiency factor YidD, partial [candidate division Zixibacteria bacterium]|nr:membrane protein insertion efficiency factor YidD [candidate division Zixibacteria bacterium]